MILRLNPTANGASADGIPTGAATNWECVDDGYGTEDDDTTYVRTDGALRRSGFKITIPGYIVGLASATSLVVESRMRSEGLTDNPYAALYARLTAGTTDGTGQSPTMSYTNYTFSNPSRPGGGSWTFADLQGSDFNIGWVTYAGSDFKRLTRINLQADLVPAPSSWQSTIASWLPGMIGGSLGLRDVLAMIRLVNARARGRLVIHGHEALGIYRALRESRHRRYCFLGAA